MKKVLLGSLIFTSIGLKKYGAKSGDRCKWQIK